MPLAFSQAERCPALDAYLADQLPAAHRATLILDVDAADEMFGGAMAAALGFRGVGVADYFKAGHELLRSVSQIMTWRVGGLGRASAFLDFACGYGRLSRFLALEVPPDRLWVSDIYAEGVRFVRDRLGAHGVVSVADPDDFRVERQFDGIVVPSLFSHLPHRTFARWLRTLYRLLTPRGVLMFSVQDEHLMDDPAAMPEGGIYFAPVSESPTLDTREYGVTFVTEAYVRAALAEASGGEAAARRLPRAFGQSQDLYVVVRDPDERFESLAFEYGPHGFLEACRQPAPHELALSGWTFDPTPGARIDHVAVSLDGTPVARVEPTLQRPDVARHVRDERYGPSGFQCTCRLQRPVEPGDLLLVKSVSTHGTEHVLHSTSVEETLAFLERQPVVARARAREARLARRFAAVAARRRGLPRTLAMIGFHYQRAGVRGIVEAGRLSLARRFSGGRHQA